MAGGTFSEHNKIRPGAYINFASGKKKAGVSASGVMAMAMALDWGTPQQMFKVTSQKDLFAMLGRAIDEKEMFLLREALKSAQQVLIFNTAGEASEKASSLLGENMVEAVQAGKLGNEITVTVVKELDNTFTIFTYYRNKLMDKQRVEMASDFKTNKYITIKGTDELEETAGLKLTNGTTVEVTNGSYANYFAALELENFYAFTVDTNDSAVHQLAITYLKEWREREGKKVIFVAGNCAADYEGVVNITNGVVLKDGTILSANECAPYIAGAMASAGISSALTYHQYEEATDASPRLSPTEIETALTQGKIVFNRVYDQVVVEQDINSLVTFTEMKNRDFRKNKIIRTIDMLNNEILKTFSTSFIGEIINNADGRELLKKDILGILEEFKKNNALETYDSEDVLVETGAEKDTVIVTLALTITDAMEKMYVSVTLN